MTRRASIHDLQLPAELRLAAGRGIAAAGASRSRRRRSWCRVGVVAGRAVGFELTGGAAAVAGDRVAVVALLARGRDAVAASGRRAVRVAAVAVVEVAVVAELGKLGRPVAAARRLVGAAVDPRSVHACAAVEVDLADRGREPRIAGVDRGRSGREVEVAAPGRG